MEPFDTHELDRSQWREITDADYEKAEMDLLRDALKRSYKERFLMMTQLIKDDIKCNPEKYPYCKLGLYIGGVLWQEGDNIIPGAEGLPHIFKSHSCR